MENQKGDEYPNLRKVSSKFLSVADSNDKIFCCCPIDKATTCKKCVTWQASIKRFALLASEAQLAGFFYLIDIIRSRMEVINITGSQSDSQGCIKREHKSIERHRAVLTYCILQDTIPS